MSAGEKEDCLIQIKEYLKHKQDNAILNTKREQETANDKANKCACELAFVISHVCEGSTSRDDIPPLVFRMLELIQETTQAYKKAIDAVRHAEWVHEKITGKNCKE